ncbi:hypothetical protein W97_02641 [Coniosporium apollinis CBS 100218]|uniref:Hydrophobin n=1 Tax=Coniosporium apollinis (strain CBS 100218) TaxID=1168221 RepID=R7YNM1_CONA1|nr:uncharacterized protein W97_02641 [Coniosporium apollinis CBS 100218]EON63414.1 hypothetical protein W97_02641 [Coniosporium apollinis CBS 100218]
MKLLYLLFFSLAGTSLAKIGDKCNSKEGSGICKKVSHCTSGFTVTGACPNDPNDVKCCVGKGCTKVNPAPLISSAGNCYDSSKIKCVGGRYEKGLCPGPRNVQCCVKAPVSNPKPKPTCPYARSVPATGPDGVIFSRQATKKIKDLYQDIESGMDLCIVVSAVASFVAPQVGIPIGVGCGLGSVGASRIANHADECLDKNQCLKLNGFSIPFCVGGNDCCTQSVGEWIDP